LQSTYIQQTAARLDVPEESLRQELRGQQKLRQRPRFSSTEDIEESEASTEVAERSVALPAERTLLQCMLSDERTVDAVTEHLDRAWLTDSVAGRLIGKITDLHRTNRWQGPDSLLSASADEEDHRVISGLLLEPSPKGTGTRAATDCLATLQKRALETEIRGLLRRLSVPDLSKTERDAIQRQVLDLNGKLKHIGALLMQTAKPSAH
jgi:hypothetical protein